MRTTSTEQNSQTTPNVTNSSFTSTTTSHSLLEEAGHSALHGGAHTAIHGISHAIPGSGYYLYPKLFGINAVLDTHERMTNPHNPSQSTTERVVCSAVGTIVNGGVVFGGSRLMDAAAPSSFGASLLGYAGLGWAGKKAGDGADRTCHKIFNLYRSFTQTPDVIPAEETSARATNTQRNAVLADVFLQAASYSTKKVQDLNTQLKHIFGEKNSDAINMAKKDFHAVQKIYAKSSHPNKEFKIDLKKEAPSLKQRAATYQKNISQMSEPLMQAGQICQGIGALTGSRDLQKVGMGIGHITQIAAAAPALMSALASGAPLMAIHPAVAIIGAVAALGSLLIDDQDQGNELAEMMEQHTQAILQPLYQMYSEFRQEFKLIHAELHTLMDMVFSGVTHLDKLIRNETQHLRQELVAKLNQIGNTIKSDIKDVHLEKSREILTKMQQRLHNPDEKSYQTPQDILNDLYCWIKPDGSLCAGLHTGINELKEIRLDKTGRELFKVSDVIKHQQSLNSSIGLLAEVAKHISKAPQFQEIKTEKLFNPDIWSALTNAYILFRNHFSADISDHDDKQLQGIYETGEEFLTFIQCIQTVPALFDGLFKGYQDALAEVPKIITDAIAAENGKMSAAMEKAHPGEEKINIDMDKDLTTNLNAATSKMLLNSVIPVSIGRHHGDNFRYSHIQDAKLNQQIPPENILLARFGIAPFIITGHISKDFLNIAINSKIDEKGEQNNLLNIKYSNLKNVAIASFYAAWATNKDKLKEKLHDILNSKSNPDITMANNIDESRTRAKARVITHLQQHRNEILETCNKTWEEPLKKLDAYYILLNTFAHLGGFPQTEKTLLEKLSTSNQIKTILKHWAEDKELKALPAHEILAKEAKSAQEIILNKINTARPEYFQSNYYQRIYLTLMGIHALSIKSHFQQKKSQNNVTGSLKEKLKPYKDIYSSWSEIYCTEWLDNLNGKAKTTAVYKNCKKNYESANKLFTELNSLEQQKDPINSVFELFKKLHKLCRDLHRDLKILDRYAPKDDKYRIADNETGFLESSEIEQLNKKIQESSAQPVKSNTPRDDKSAYYPSSFFYSNEKPKKIGVFKNNKNIIFEELETKGDGRCGFYSTGVSPEEAVEILLKQENNEAARRELADEIAQEVGRDILTNNKARWQGADLKQSALSDDLAKKYQANHNKNDAQSQQKEMETQQELKQFCTQALIYKKYVSALKEPSAWLGCKSAKLVAQYNKKPFSLCVWEKDGTTPDKIKIRDQDSYLDEKLTDIRHIYYTNGYTHFNLLAESKGELSLTHKASPSQTGLFSTQKITPATHNISSATVALGNFNF